MGYLDEMVEDQHRNRAKGKYLSMTTGEMEREYVARGKALAEAVEYYS